MDHLRRDSKRIELRLHGKDAQNADLTHFVPDRFRVFRRDVLVNEIDKFIKRHSSLNWLSEFLDEVWPFDELHKEVIEDSDLERIEEVNDYIGSEDAFEVIDLQRVS